MAIDSENKRRAASSTGPFRRMAPVPDGAISSASDRSQIVGRYNIVSTIAVSICVSLVGVTQELLSIAGAAATSTVVEGVSQLQHMLKRCR